MLLKDKLRNNRLIGYWSILPLVQLHEIFGQSGFDFSILDLEHGTYNFQNIVECLPAIENSGMYSLVRPSSHDEKEILRCLETGAAGICIPHMRTAEEVDKIVLACLYPPHGNRGASGFTRATLFGQKNFAQHTQDENHQLFICVLIESIEGLNNIVDICKNERIDCIYFGSYDIASSAGIADQNSIEVNNLVSQAIDRLEGSDLVFGQVAINKQQLNSIDPRVNFVPFGVDCGIIQNGATNIISEVKSKE